MAELECGERKDTASTTYREEKHTAYQVVQSIDATVRRRRILFAGLHGRGAPAEEGDVWGDGWG